MVWQANLDKNRYLLIFEIHFIIFETHLNSRDCLKCVFKYKKIISYIRKKNSNIRKYFQILENSYIINSYKFLNSYIRKYM